MILKRISEFTGKVNEMELPITEQELIDGMKRCWCFSADREGEHIQAVFPQLTASQREFIKTGATDEEWDAMFKNEEDN